MRISDWSSDVCSSDLVGRVKLNMRLDLAKVAHHHRTVWTGFLVPPATGTYRLGLSGSCGTLKFDGNTLVDRRKARWHDLPTMKTVTLARGHRYPIAVDATGGVGLDLKRVVEGTRGSGRLDLGGGG